MEKRRKGREKGRVSKEEERVCESLRLKMLKKPREEEKPAPRKRVFSFMWMEEEEKKGWERRRAVEKGRATAAAVVARW